MKRISALLLLSFFLSLHVYSQPSVVLPESQNSILYRGFKPNIYRTPDKGTYFAFSPEYSIGAVEYRNKTYKNVSLNLNSHADELYIKDDNNNVILLSKEHVLRFSMGGKNFVNMEKSDYKWIGQLPDRGYYELIYDGSWVFIRKIVKKYQENIARVVSNTESSNPFYTEKSYILKEDCYLVKEDKCYKIKSVKNFISHFPEQKKELRRVVAEYEYNNPDSDDQYYIYLYLLNYLNSL